MECYAVVIHKLILSRSKESPSKKGGEQPSVSVAR